MVMIRPSRWPGTIACRRLPVLMLNSPPSPEDRAQHSTAIQKVGAIARATVRTPAAMSEPSATFPKLHRFRSGPAASEHTNTPTPPAAKRMPIWASLAA